MKTGQIEISSYCLRFDQQIASRFGLFKLDDQTSYSRRLGRGVIQSLGGCMVRGSLLQELEGADTSLPEDASIPDNAGTGCERFQARAVTGRSWARARTTLIALTGQLAGKPSDENRLRLQRHHVHQVAVTRSATVEVLCGVVSAMHQFARVRACVRLPKQRACPEMHRSPPTWAMAQNSRTRMPSRLRLVDGMLNGVTSNGARPPHYAPPSRLAYSSSIASSYFCSAERGSSCSTPPLTRASGSGRCEILSLSLSSSMLLSSCGRALKSAHPC